LWLPQPDHLEKVAAITAPATIYTGNAGTALFLFQLAKSTGDSSYLDDARAGADYVAHLAGSFAGAISSILVETSAWISPRALGHH
jgi:hypothetical protein